MPSPFPDQKAFVTALRDPHTPPPDGLAGRDSEIPVRRFDVYRNNVHASLIDVLAARFPVVERLVGEEFFRAMARAFIATSLPQSPVLIEYGGNLADFIDGFPPAQSLPYLGDVARLEWAWHEAYHAADAEPLELDRLSTLLQSSEPNDLARMNLALHPTLRIVHSEWPVLDIWRTNTEDDDVRHVALDVGAADVLVARPGWDVTLWPLPAGGSDFVAALVSAAPLGTAAEHAAGADPAFDPAATLRILAAAGCITGLSRTHDDPSTQER